MEERNTALLDTSQLTLRLAAGGMLLFGHGLGKMLHFADVAPSFPDPLGVGSGVSLALAATVETAGALAVMAGLKTRWAALAVAATLLVAAVGVHWGDGFSGMESALSYVVMFGAIAIGGGGRFSVDGMLDQQTDVGGMTKSAA